MHTETRVFSLKQYNLEHKLNYTLPLWPKDLMTTNDTKTTGQPVISSLNQEKAIAALAALSYRTGELDDYLKQICQSVLDVLGDGAAAVTLYRNGKKNVIARVPHSPKVGVPLDIHGHLSTFVVESGKVLNVADAHETPQYGNPPAGFCSYLGIPLKLPDGQVVGTLCYFDKSKRDFSLQDEQVASLFAERIAIALDNYELFLQLKSHSENLEALVEARTEELLSTQKALLQKEKLAAIGEFASHLTHEIRNPLATIKLALEYFERLDDARGAKRATLAGSEITRLERMLNEVLSYARPIEISTHTLKLSDFLDYFISTNDAMLDAKQQVFSVDKQAQPEVLADGDKLNQILLNLARNACEAAEATHTISWTLSEAESFAKLSIHNKGEYIPADKLATISEAFVSTKTRGTGLGLAIVKNLLSAQQGKLEIQSNAEDGTLISIYLPLVNALNRAEEGTSS